MQYSDFSKGKCIYKWEIIQAFSNFVALYGILNTKLKEKFAYS